MKKTAATMFPITSPGSPEIPDTKGTPGIPSPNPGYTSNVRGATDADFVARAPKMDANDGLRASSIPTQQKKASLGFDDIIQAIKMPALAGGAMGFFAADDDDKLAGMLRGATIGAGTGLLVSHGKNLIMAKTPISGLVASKIQTTNTALKEAVRRIATAKDKLMPNYPLLQDDIKKLLERNEDAIPKVNSHKNLEDVWNEYNNIIKSHSDMLKKMERSVPAMKPKMPSIPFSQQPMQVKRPQQQNNELSKLIQELKQLG